MKSLLLVEDGELVLTPLKSVLEETYRVGPNEELEDSENVDVIIIIGISKQLQS